MAKKTFLNFEQPIAELESKIEELRYVQVESAVDISEEIEQLSKKSQQLTKDIYSDLTPWQITKIARHPERPYTMDYINDIFSDFVEMHGDRHFADDQSIVGGLARLRLIRTAEYAALPKRSAGASALSMRASTRCGAAQSEPLNLIRPPPWKWTFCPKRSGC